MKISLASPLALLTVSSANAQVAWMDSDLLDSDGGSAVQFSGVSPKVQSATIHDLGVTHTITPLFASAATGNNPIGDGSEHAVYASPRMLNGVAGPNPDQFVRINSALSQSSILGWNQGATHDAVVTFLNQPSDTGSNTMTHELEFSRTVSRNHQLLLAGIDRTSESLRVEFFNGGVKITDISPLSFILDQDYSDVARAGDSDDGNPASDGNPPLTVASFATVGGDITMDGESTFDGGTGNNATADWSVLIVDIPETFNYDELRLTFSTDGSSDPDYDSFGFTVVQAIPEPSGLSLGLLGCLALLARRRR